MEHEKPRFFSAEAKQLALLVLLLAAYVFFGLTGHDPWKADEAYNFGVIHSMLEDGSWLVPLVAGEPFMEKPPLYAWVAAGLVKILHGWVSEPDAARMASGVFMGFAVWAVASAAHQWWGNGVGRYAPLILCGCLGLIVQSHMMMPDIPLLTGVSLALWGLSCVSQSLSKGGGLIGLGIGISFLAKGLLGPGVIGLTLILLPLIFTQWRVKTYAYGLLVAFVVALPFLVIWPLLLYRQSPPLFFSWFWDNNFGRFLGSAEVAHGTEVPPWFWLKTLPWFAFPALPLAMHVLYVKRKLFFSDPGMQCTTLMSVVILLAISLSASARAVYAFPLLVPLAVLAAPSVFTLGAIGDRLWFWASVVIFWPLATGAWVAWLIMMQTGTTPDWLWLRQLLPAEFVPQFDTATFGIAVAATLMAAAGTARAIRMQGAGLLGWMIGMTLSWTLLSTLTMPWLDYGKSYRTVFESIPWPAAHRCVASRGLGESERAMLDYYADRLTIRREISEKANCDLLLIQGYQEIGVENVDARKWKLIWSGSRPGDTWQKFWMFEEHRYALTLPK